MATDVEKGNGSDANAVTDHLSQRAQERAPEEVYSASKTGNGAFTLSVRSDGLTIVNGRSYASPQEAYDTYRQRTNFLGDHSAWNVCYHLEDVIEGNVLGLDLPEAAVS